MSKIYLSISILGFLAMALVAHADNNPYSPENNPYSPRNNPYSAENNRYNMESVVRGAASIHAAPYINVVPVPDLPNMAIWVVHTYNNAGEVVSSRLVIIRGD